MIARADTFGVARTGSNRPKAVGVLGVALGVFAAWLALPPVAVRAVAVPVVVGGLAVAAGLWTARHRLLRLGWGAVAAGVLGGGLGALATQANADKLALVFVWSTLVAATLGWATPLVFASIGGMFSERSGVVNIGLEGMMLMGAFFGAWGADKSHSWVGGLAIAIVAGAALALVHAVFAIHLRSDQIVSGTAVNFIALGLTGYLYIDLYGNEGTPPGLPSIPNVDIPGLENVYFIGPAFARLNLMIWIVVGVLLVSYLVMFRTPLGLRIRSVGEHPRAADTVGISVFRIRYGSVLTSGALAALGGAYLSLGDVHSFTENMTAGRGFIALAALIFGKWRPFGAAAAALLFGFASILGDRLPNYFGNTESAASLGTVFNSLPYVLTLIAVAGIIGRSIPPAAVGRPYKKQ